MAHQPTARQFQETRAVLDARATNDMVRQQRLFRLFQALQANKLEQAEILVHEQGVALDEFLLADHLKGSVPQANRFVDAVPPADPPQPPMITLLAWAAAEGRTDTLLWLLDQGATLTMRLPGGRDAAWVAMERGQEEACEVLMSQGATPDLRLSEGVRLTRLMGATLARQVGLVTYLLATDRVRLDQHDDQGRTALHHSFRQDPYTQEDLEITRLLLAAGADGYYTDNEGINPVDWATRDAQLELLNELGVDLSMQNPIQTPEVAFEPDGPAPDQPAPPRPAPRPTPPGRRR